MECISEPPEATAKLHGCWDTWSHDYVLALVLALSLKTTAVASGLLCFKRHGKGLVMTWLL